jgi:hypothetical protein
MANFNVTIGEKLICPVCGKEFIASDGTKYIVAGGFTCSWKCFLIRVKSMPPKEEKMKPRKNCK